LTSIVFFSHPNPNPTYLPTHEFLSPNNEQVRTQGGMQGMHPPHQTKRGVGMTLDFIETHRRKYFCTAQYLIAKDSIIFITFITSCKTSSIKVRLC